MITAAEIGAILGLAGLLVLLAALWISATLGERPDHWERLLRGSGRKRRRRDRRD